MGKKETYFDAAEELYVVEGLTLEAIAARFGEDGPSVTTLSIWKQEGEWSERRRELAASLAAIKRDTFKLRQDLLKKVLESPEPQNVYAWARVEELLSRGRPAAAAPMPESTGPEIKTPAQAVALLEDAVQRQLWGLLTEPGKLTLAAIKDLKQVWALIDDLKSQYRPEEVGEASQPGLSEEAAEKIKRQILGIA